MMKQSKIIITLCLCSLILFVISCNDCYRRESSDLLIVNYNDWEGPMTQVLYHYVVTYFDIPHNKADIINHIDYVLKGLTNDESYLVFMGDSYRLIYDLRNICSRFKEFGDSCYYKSAYSLNGYHEEVLAKSPAYILTHQSDLSFFQLKQFVGAFEPQFYDESGLFIYLPELQCVSFKNELRLIRKKYGILYCDGEEHLPFYTIFTARQKESLSYLDIVNNFSNLSIIDTSDNVIEYKKGAISSHYLNELDSLTKTFLFNNPDVKQIRFLFTLGCDAN